MYPKSNIGQMVSVITKNRFNGHINEADFGCPTIYNISDSCKNVTKCPSGREADMPVDFLTIEQTESYGRFTGEPDELQLARYFHLDEVDKEFIGKSRGDHNRLGIALQIGCVRFLGTFLTDMNHIPSGVRHFIARQLAIHDITVLAEYGQRENTRREHAALIRQHYDYREFAWPWTFRLTRLLYTRSWISNERPGLLFDLATGWLMQHRIILPGATTLTRLISEVSEKATLRLWSRLAMIPSAVQRSQLETLLGPADSGRLSLLESQIKKVR